MRVTQGTTASRSPFETFQAEDVRALIEEFPLAWVCAAHGGAFEASLLPLLAEFDGEGRPSELVGHLARRNPLAAALEANPQATVLFKGPDGYIAASQAGRRDWAPTWNYAQLRVDVDVRFVPDETDAAVARLVDAMEARQDEPWHVAELGARYAGMARQIVAFRATVISLSGRFKLGQDERPDTFRSIVAGEDDPTLERWMRRMNGTRRP